MRRLKGEVEKKHHQQAEDAHRRQRLATPPLHAKVFYEDCPHDAQVMHKIVGREQTAIRSIVAIMQPPNASIEGQMLSAFCLLLTVFLRDNPQCPERCFT